MGNLRKPSWSARLVVLFCIAACVLFFQNMSPTDDDSFDIREIAPQKPEGSDSKTDYLPPDLNGRTPEEIANEILRHNLQGSLDQLQMRFQYDSHRVQTGSGRGPASIGPDGKKLDQLSDQEKESILKMGHMGGDRLGMAYESDLQFRCDYSVKGQFLQLSLDRSLSRNSNVSLKHQTGRQESTVNFSYQW